MKTLYSFKTRTTHSTKQHHHIPEVLNRHMTNNLPLLHTCKFPCTVADVDQRILLWDHKFVSAYWRNVLPPIFKVTELVLTGF